MRYWELTETEYKDYEGLVLFSQHPDYLDNGVYTLQISLFNYGIIEKTFVLNDVYGNLQGPNYGLMLPYQIDNSRSQIQLVLHNEAMIAELEFELYDINTLAPISSFISTQIKNVYQKKELLYEFKRHAIKKQFAMNTDYYYIVRSKTNTINGFQFEASSEMMPFISLVFPI